MLLLHITTCHFLTIYFSIFPPGFSTVNSVVGNTVVAVGAVPGIGTGERLFPPQAGLTFATWVCVDRFSNAEDRHPVRLLTIARQFRSSDGKVQNSPCLTLSISALDKTLVVRSHSHNTCT